MSTGLLTQLETYYESIEERQPPISIDELMSVRAQIHELPIRPEPPSTRLRLKPLWIAVATAAVILLIVGGLSALLRNTGGFEPIEQPEITPTLPESDDGDASLLVDSGELGTVDGTIRWSRLQGPPRVLPGDFRMSPLATTWGFALFDPGSRVASIFDQDIARLWLSEDLVDWRLATLPVQAEGTAAIGVVNDALWLVTLDPPAVWTSNDGMEWSGFDTPEINERPPGVEPPATTVFAPVALNDQVLFVVSHGQALTTLYRVEGESVKPVELSPTSGALVQAFNPGLLLSTGDSLLAYAEGSVWRTTDGSQWSRISSQFLDGRPSSEDALVTTLSDRFVYTPVEFGSFIAEAWESTDGVTWDPAPVAPPPQTNLVRLDTGWFAAGGSVSGEIHGNSWWMLVSDEWVSLEAMGTEECFVATPIALGGFTLLSGVGCGPDTEDLLDLWLVTLDEE